MVDTSDDLVGQVIDGRFEVLSPLGQGGMGIVYRAKQLSIGREVAVKVLDRRIEKDVKAVQRFFREAKLASTLQHPNTVPVIEFGQHADGRLFLAMELVNGNTLLDTINKQGAFAVDRVVAIGAQLCDALEAAHDLQIVHRDLKLENVMVLAGKRDLVKVLDFGLARSLVDPTTAHTATGLISGTPRYMAPEVALDGAQPAPSQDMYALGVMLAEMAIGRPLWSAPTMEALFIKKQETESAIADVPPALKRIVRMLLATEPERRPTAGQTRQLLRDVQPTSAPPVKLELDAIATEPTNIMVEVSNSPDPFAALDTAGTIALDDVSPGIPSDATIKVPPPAMVMATEHDPRFSVPDEHELPADKLEIDRGYLEQRAAKIAARTTTPVPEPKVGLTRQQKEARSNLWRNLVALLVIAVVGGGAYYYWFHIREAKKTGVTVYGPNH